MLSKTILFVSSVIFCSTLVACSDVDNSATQATNAVTEEKPAVTAVVPKVSPSAQEIKAGMSEQAVTELLGEPTIIQTSSLDTLMLTHSEWVNDTGTTSVQFLNGIVQYFQFTPATK